MADPSPCRNKKKLTLAASDAGVEIAKKALLRLGFESKSNFAESQRLSRTTVTKFFNQDPIQLDSFKRICAPLKLNWHDIAGMTTENIDRDIIESQVTLSSNVMEEGAPVKTLVRQVTILEKTSQTIKTVITLTGEIDSASNIQVIAAILKEHGGDTIQINDIQAGSIKLFVEGSLEDIDRLLNKIRSGELTEIDGFPVEGIQILRESSEEESSEQKWRLVEEIVTNRMEGRDLSGVDLSDADLRNACLFRANLNGADLSNADLGGAKLIVANLSDANLSGANLSGVNLSGANLSYVNLNDVNLSGVNLSGANLSYVKLNDANLSGADLRLTNLSDADLSDADLSGANLSGANLNAVNLVSYLSTDINLTGISLRGANLSGADLNCAYLSGADLSFANLSDANLMGTYLNTANLSGADLSGANLSGAKLSGANLSGIQVKKTRFSDDSGITEQLKQYLISRGAIFEDSLGDRSYISTRV